jgi:hypothetical protein
MVECKDGVSNGGISQRKLRLDQYIDKRFKVELTSSVENPIGNPFLEGKKRGKEIYGNWALHDSTQCLKLLLCDEELPNQRQNIKQTVDEADLLFLQLTIVSNLFLCV